MHRLCIDELSLFFLETAPESYWHIMAEHYRMKLEDVTRENQQVGNEWARISYCEGFLI